MSAECSSAGADRSAAAKRRAIVVEERSMRLPDDPPGPARRVRRLRLDGHISPDIIDNIMGLGLAKIRKLRSEIEALRKRRGVKSAELESLAQRLGRTRAKRGKEPTWVNEELPETRPLSIPNHLGDLNRFTVRSILDHLEADLDRYEELLS
jgi:hypothetical protein